MIKFVKTVYHILVIAMMMMMMILWQCSFKRLLTEVIASAAIAVYVSIASFGTVIVIKSVFKFRYSDTIAKLLFNFTLLVGLMFEKCAKN